MTKATLLTCAASLLMLAADWPQWQGPNRDNISKETGLLKKWPASGPPLLWTFKEAGLGYSSPAIVGDRLYMTGARKDEEYVYALDLKANPPKELWAIKLGKTFGFKGNVWGDGPRITPTVDGDLLYALGGFGDLVCVDVVKGKEIWRKNLPNDLKAVVDPVGGGPANLGWGFSWACLVDGKQLICVPGGDDGTLAALDKVTGKVIWRSKDLKDMASYSSPIAVDAGGVHQYVIATNSGLKGVEAKTGKLLWTYERKYTDVLCPTPIYQEDQVYMAAGFGAGCDLIQLTKAGGNFTATKVYANKDMKNDHGGVILLDGYLYGYSDKKGWVCQDFKTGKPKWADKNSLKAGSLTVADGCLYCFEMEEATVVLVPAQSKGWQEGGRFQLPERTKNQSPNGKAWTHPVVANGKLYLRDQELLFCYDVQDPKAEKP